MKLDSNTGSILARRSIVRKAKSAPCMDCKRTYPYYIMDFDHRPGETKLFAIGEGNKSTPKVIAEIAKCDVICANCHRERTHLRRIGAM